MKQSILLAAGLALALAGAVQGGELVRNDGILHVLNASVPADGREVLELEELWRVGGDDDELFFGLITQVRVDDAGNILLLDEVRSQVFVLDSSGELIDTLSREGDGPGETRDPNDMVLLADGRVGLATTGRLVTVDRDGDPAGDILINHRPGGRGGTSAVTSVHSGGGNLAIGSTDFAMDPETGESSRESVVASYNLDGERVAVHHRRDTRFGSNPFTFSETKNLEFDTYRTGVGPDGRVYCATEYGAYRVAVYHADGGVDRIIEREQEPVERSAAEYDAFHDLYDTMLQRAVPPPYKLEVASHEPAICWMQRGLQVAPDGRLWILPASGVRNQPEGVYQTFDVFSPDGHFEKQVAMPGEDDARKDAVFLAGPDHLVRVTGFADALMAKVGGGGGSVDDEAAPMQVVYYGIK